MNKNKKNTARKYSNLKNTFILKRSVFPTNKKYLFDKDFDPEIVGKELADKSVNSNKYILLSCK